jgi:YVTN family beta-propeller protein
MVLPYNAAAITTLDRLESEGNIMGQNNLGLDTKKYPTDVAVNEFDNIAYVANSDSDTISVINGDTLKVSSVKVGDTLYNDGKLDHYDIESLNQLMNRVEDTYAKGKINNEHYTRLRSRTSILYQEIYKKIIDSLYDLPITHNSKGDRLLSKLEDNIEDAYAKGKINEQHYKLLNKKIQSFVNTNNNKTSDDKLEHAK